MFSETDLNKSSTLMHDYDKHSTQSDRQIRRGNCNIWVTHHFRACAWIMVWPTKVAVTCKAGKARCGHSRAPSKRFWNTASHCETVNQQASSVGLAQDVCAPAFGCEKTWGPQTVVYNKIYNHAGETHHTPSLMTAVPNHVLNNQSFGN